MLCSRCAGADLYRRLRAFSTTRAILDFDDRRARAKSRRFDSYVHALRLQSRDGATWDKHRRGAERHGLIA